MAVVSNGSKAVEAMAAVAGVTDPINEVELALGVKMRPRNVAGAWVAQEGTDAG